MLRFLKKIIRKLIVRLIGIETIPKWKPSIDSYKELRALKFSSISEVEKAIDFLYTRELHECPHDLVGRNTIIVPREAEGLYAKAGFDFESTEVISAGDLPPEEIHELRRRQGTF